jgi:hypothetical protein
LQKSIKIRKNKRKKKLSTDEKQEKKLNFQREIVKQKLPVLGRNRKREREKERFEEEMAARTVTSRAKKEGMHKLVICRK